MGWMVGPKCGIWDDDCMTFDFLLAGGRHGERGTNVTISLGASVGDKRVNDDYDESVFIYLLADTPDDIQVP